MRFSDLKNLEDFMNVHKLCGISKEISKKIGWWNDSANEKKKGYVLEINKKFNKLGIQGELVVRNTKYDGVYNLNKNIQATKIKDL